jgi:hypothetical protein
MWMLSFICFVAFIPGTFEVDTVGLEVSWETAVVACPLVVPGGVCIAFSRLSLSTHFGDMIVHFAARAFVLLEFVSLSTFLSTTGTGTATVSAGGR